MMTPTLFWAILLAAGTAMIAIVACRPDWLNDSNGFLKSFINHEYLNVLGVILAITLASLAQIHLKINEIEEKVNSPVMKNAHSELKSSAIWLISLFVSGVFLVIVKPLVADFGSAPAIINAGALFILLFNVLILTDVTLSIFGIGPVLTEESENDGQQETTDAQRGQKDESD